MTVPRPVRPRPHLVGLRGRHADEGGEVASRVGQGHGTLGAEPGLPDQGQIHTYMVYVEEAGSI